MMTAERGRFRISICVTKKMPRATTITDGASTTRLMSMRPEIATLARTDFRMAGALGDRALATSAARCVASAIQKSSCVGRQWYASVPMNGAYAHHARTFREYAAAAAAAADTDTAAAATAVPALTAANFRCPKGQIGS